MCLHVRLCVLCMLILSVCLHVCVTPHTCHEEEQPPNMLRETLLPEKADSGHDAATEQHSHGHAQEAGGDPTQVWGEWGA